VPKYYAFMFVTIIEFLQDFTRSQTLHLVGKEKLKRLHYRRA